MARNKKRRPSTSLPQLQELTKEVTSELHELFDRFASEQDKKITAILNSLKDIQQTNSMIQSSITYLSEENSEMKNKIAQLESESKRDKEQILLLESKFEDTQRNDRKCNIEIRNVPINGNESKSELFEMIDMTKQDIKDILKINKNKNKKEKSTIVVEFTNTFIKTCILKGAKTYNIKNRDNKLKALTYISV
jgi:chromosome segregation ATPase